MPNNTLLKALANGFNICFNIHSILLNAVERLLHDVEHGMGKRFKHFIQQNLASGLVISFRPQLLAHMHARAPFRNDTMDRVYVYNKVRSLLAVFVAFEVLKDEDKKTQKGKDKAMDQKKGQKGIFRQHRQVIGDRRQRNVTQDMMRMSHADFQRTLSYIEQDITRKQVLGGNKVISPKERLALTISHTQNCLALLPSLHPW